MMGERVFGIMRRCMQAEHGASPGTAHLRQFYEDVGPASPPYVWHGKLEEVRVNFPGKVLSAQPYSCVSGSEPVSFGHVFLAGMIT